MANLLVSHELEEVAILSSEAISGEFSLREGRQSPVEEVKLDPFLVKGERKGLVVKVAHGLVHGLGTVGIAATGWCVGRRERGMKFAVRWILEGIGRRTQGCNRCG
jgi:hypothetical protein